jgi:phage gp29-like protein
MSAASDIAKKLTDDENKQITGLHRQAQEIVHAIGQTEVRKAKLLSQLADVEEQAQGVMNSVGVRLGLPQGVPWHITPDGNVVVVDPKTGQPAQ